MCLKGDFEALFQIEEKDLLNRQVELLQLDQIIKIIGDSKQKIIPDKVTGSLAQTYEEVKENDSLHQFKETFDEEFSQVRLRLNSDEKSLDQAWNELYRDQIDDFE